MIISLPVQNFQTLEKFEQAKMEKLIPLEAKITLGKQLY